VAKTDPRRRRPTGWMDGYRPEPSLKAACDALEQRLNEGRPRPWADAQRLPLSELDWWAL
jgi:hypothetical protein